MLPLFTMLLPMLMDSPLLMGMGTLHLPLLMVTRLPPQAMVILPLLQPMVTLLPTMEATDMNNPNTIVQLLT